MKNEGWIKLHRKSFDNFLYQENRPLTKREAWEDMLMICNHTPNKVLIDNTVIEVLRGQSIWSLQSWAKHFKWSIQSVRSFFKLLESEGMIKKEGLRKTTRITICNYGLYQDKQHADNTQITDKQHADNTQVTDEQHTDNTPVTTNKNDNNFKNVKNVDNERGLNFVAPTIEQVIDFFLANQSTKSLAADFFLTYEGTDWYSGNTKISKWEKYALKWIKKEIPYDKKHPWKFEEDKMVELIKNNS